MNGYNGPAPDFAAAIAATQLPTKLQRAGAEARRQGIARQDVGEGKTVTLDRVELGRGWRYEVNATYDTRDQDGPVRRTDSLWFAAHDPARVLFRAAGVRLVAAPSDFAREGLTGLARELGLRFEVQ